MRSALANREEAVLLMPTPLHRDKTRKYALKKLAVGDYLLPSNDGRRLWRISLYHEKGRRLWLIQRWLGPLTLQGNYWSIDPSELFDWNLWETWDTDYLTRSEAIDKALRAV